MYSCPALSGHPIIHLGFYLSAKSNPPSMSNCSTSLEWSLPLFIILLLHAALNSHARWWWHASWCAVSRLVFLPSHAPRALQTLSSTSVCYIGFLPISRTNLTLSSDSSCHGIAWNDAPFIVLVSTDFSPIGCLIPINSCHHCYRAIMGCLWSHPPGGLSSPAVLMSLHNCPLLLGCAESSPSRIVSVCWLDGG
jgi:hypothetical protein